MSLVRLALAVAFTATFVTAQSSLLTTLQGGNGQKGTMFNINNISAGPITVTSLAQNFLGAGTSNVEIYTKTGSYVGSEAIAANWTLAASAAGLVHGGAGTAVTIPSLVNTTIPAGATQAFYVTVTAATATNVAYTNGTLVVPATSAGAVAFADANIQFVCGVGKSYPFGATFGGPTPGGAGRCWNGRIDYVLGGPPAVPWQVNQPVAYMDFDFVLATATTPAKITKCVGAPVNACADSFGAPADIALNSVPTVSSAAGGVALTPNTVVNLDLAGGFLFLLGGTFALPLGAAVGTCPIFFNAFPGTLSAQMVAIDPTSPIMLTLSQACEATGVAAGPVTLPNADDSLYLVNTTAAPLCNTAGLNYYGTTYTNFVVSTNGIVFPGTAGNNQWVPSAANALTYPGLFGVWSDWQANANPAASIVMSNNAVFGGFDINFTNVPYWGTTINSTFKVALDTIGPRLEGLTGLGTDPTTPSGLFVSKGVGFATDPGATAFAVGTGTTAVATDMLYAVGTGTPTLAGGANNLWFTFNATGGVDWMGL
jgi:hypothetical protein